MEKPTSGGPEASLRTNAILPLKKQSRHFRIYSTLSLIIPHTIFWIYFKNYSTGLYVLMISSILFLSSSYALRKFQPKKADLVITVFFGTFSPLMVSILPEYSLLALVIHILCMTFSAWEIRVRNACALPLINVLCWIICYSIYQYRSPNGLEEAISFINNTSIFAQAALSIFISYISLYAIVKQRISQIGLRKEYERKLLLLNKELEEANLKLQKANQELKHALQEKDNFTLRFSHEIRNPLNSLLGNVELCYECVGEGEVRNMLKEAKISGEILLQLINNVLDTAKLSTGRLDISTSPHDVREFLERSWIVCSEIIKKKGLYGSLSVNSNVPDVLDFDHHRLMQILINTISNATKFTDSGFVKVYVEYKAGNEIEPSDMKPRHSEFYYSHSRQEIIEEVLNLDLISENLKERFDVLTTKNKRFRSERNWGQKLQRDCSARVYTAPNFESDEKELEILSNKPPHPLLKKFPQKDKQASNGFIRLEVVDSGCGISKSELESLFKKFSQVHEQSSKRQIGTGLGLWITKEIIGLMQGKIEMHSLPKHGTTVVIMLKTRYCTGEVGATTYRDQNSMKQQRTSSSRGAKVNRALIVEDIPYNREVNRRLIEKCNVTEIMTSSDGKIALELFKSKGEGYFDVILMDIDMPVMDGKTCVKLMRQHEALHGWKPCVIIFLTAYSESKIQAEMLDKHGEYRANAFLSKPASFMTLFSTIKQSFENILDGDLQMLGVNSTQSVSMNVFSLSKIIESDGKSEQVILVVDDDSFNLSMLSKMLHMCGYVALEAKNGKLAVDLFEKHWKDIKLVLMDCEMPVMSGFEATKTIIAKHKTKKEFTNREIAIYGLTGHVGIEYKQKCLEVGMKGVLEKPITVERLTSLLKDGLVKN